MSNSKNHLEIGKKGEEIAVKHLKSRGYYILDRNFRTKFGEIDIIAVSPDRTLTFVEVKTMKYDPRKKIMPEDQMTLKKIKNFEKCSEYYFNKLGENKTNKFNNCRLEVVTINLMEDGKYNLTHYENI